MDYRQSGVNIEAGNALVEWLKEETPPTQPHKERLVSGLGGFSALFRADFPEMKSPCLVSATDGVGTKVLLASRFQSFEGVGQDLVAMCINDLICCGAHPLFFLDYYATGHLDLHSAQAFLKGVQLACQESHCALVGGETAEMPGLYRKGEFDCAGFAVGVVDEKDALGPQRVKVGDRLMGFPSSGFHSNGFSLLRKVLESENQLDNWRDELMKPTKLYARPIHQLLKAGDESECKEKTSTREPSPKNSKPKFKVTTTSSSHREDTGIHALAHITGGGLDNLCRVMPPNTQAHLKDWTIPKSFLDIEKMAQLSRDSLLKTFNCGLGMVALVEPSQWDPLFQKAGEVNLSPIDLGLIEASPTTKPTWTLPSLEVSHES